ncbi:transposase, partial [Arenibaculum sp.]|uniref:transposase n=1 Tax=Arenibaculum sp. TaxID=2865862 RepID=UPI002E140235|nr:transposase [Arenibaculum sp.]
RDLARHYTLSPEDLASVARRRGEHSRLGHALMLLYLRHPGRPLRADGEWLVEKHGTKTRRGWRKLHLATDADTGRIVASALTDKNADDSSQVGPLLDRIEGPVASFTGDGAYDRDDVYAEVAARHHEAAVVVPPRSGAVLGDTAGTAPTQRDRHIEAIAERALVESDVSRWKRVIGDGLRSQTNGRQATEVAIAADVLNRMLDLGRPEYIRIA